MKNRSIMVLAALLLSLLPFAGFADTENTHTPMDPEDEILDGDWEWDGWYRGPSENTDTISFFRDGIFAGYDSDGNLVSTGSWDITEGRRWPTLRIDYELPDTYDVHYQKYELQTREGEPEIILKLVYTMEDGFRNVYDAGEKIFLLPLDM